METVTEQMQMLHKQCDDDLQIKLQRAYEANRLILEKLTIVFGKLDTVMRLQGIAYVARE